MDDVIYRRAAIDNMAMVIWRYPNEIYPLLSDLTMALALAKDGLMGVPSAQKKGHWVENHDSDHTWKCSECGCGYTDSKLSFCYDCGADMRGEADG